MSTLRGRGGFSLIELVLAIGLFAMLAMFVFSTMDSTLKLWSEGERRGRGDLVFASVAERLRSDLRSMHTGHRGWMELDQWEVIPPDDVRPGVVLPRLRFLASGKGLPADDPTGMSAVEVAYVFEVEDREEGLFRLIRLSLVEGLGGDLSMQNDRSVASMVNQGLGMVLLDGICHATIQVLDTNGDWVDAASIPPETPFDFPSQVRMHLERVSGNVREQPPVLDVDLLVSDSSMTLRGLEPIGATNYVLVGREWIRTNGNWPRPGLTQRGDRGTLPAKHDRGSIVWMPQSYDVSFEIRGDGQRIPRNGWRKGVWEEEL